MRDSWEIRFEWIQSILQWTALVFGAGLSLLSDGIHAATIGAAAAVTAYTVAMHSIPRRHRLNGLVGGLLALLGVVTGLLAIGLTGGLESPYLLYLVVPVFFASALHGTVLGSVTALAAILGLVALAQASGLGASSSTLALMIAFYALVSITFSQARRILVEEPLESVGVGPIRRLESAHDLLSDLAALASSSELNPVAIGRSALRNLAVDVPFAAGSIAIIDGDESITVATRGQPGSPDRAVLVDISLGSEQVGTLTLWPLSDGNVASQIPVINHHMNAVALAFDNVLLLQSIAHRAVREERVRLARELHDDIGPSLVSVGLGLDLMLHSDSLDDEADKRLRELRETVTTLVDEVRATVANLREAEVASLREHADALAADVPADGPSILIDVSEQSVPARGDVEELAAIMSEAFRNALEHAHATVIRIEGSVAREHGRFCVCDNGMGLDPSNASPNRYGLIGMRERADRIGARLSIAATHGGGTTIDVRWGKG